MSLTGSRSDPFLAFRFEVSFTGLGTVGFSECSGIALETETFDYPEGGENTFVHRLPTRSKQSNLVLKRGIINRQLWDWHHAQTLGILQRRSGQIVVKNPSGGQAVMIFEFSNAFPVKLTGPDLSAAQNAVAVETLELAHGGITRTL